MKPKILLTGKSGQLGDDLQHILPGLGDLVATDRRQLDLSRPNEIRKLIRDVHPSLIVNAAAYTAVDQAEKDEPLARAINSEAPAIMAEEAKKIGAAIVHYSTDYVFDGGKNCPYDENDPPNPVSAYGRTKLAGEQAVRELGVNHLIFRTAWVYSTRGKNFLLTILRLATQREELRIVADQVGAPTWSREIAGATVKALQQICGRNDRTATWSEWSGTYHMTAGGESTWCEFTQAILQEAAQSPHSAAWIQAATNGKELITRRVIPITTAEYPTPARRPAYSVLSNSKLNRVFGIQSPDWRQQLNEVFSRNPSHTP
jgi:dTDP-4-dehydrorhamnose reductase